MTPVMIKTYKHTPTEKSKYLISFKQDRATFLECSLNFIAAVRNTEKRIIFCRIIYFDHPLSPTHLFPDHVKWSTKIIHS